MYPCIPIFLKLNKKKELIEKSAQYYEQISKSWADICDVIEYTNKTEKLLEEEERLFKIYFRPKSCNQAYAQIILKIIDEKSEFILNKNNIIILLYSDKKFEVF